MGGTVEGQCSSGADAHLQIVALTSPIDDVLEVIDKLVFEADLSNLQLDGFDFGQLSDRSEGIDGFACAVGS